MSEKLKITKDTHFMTSGLEVVSMPRQVKIASRMSGSSYDEAKANAQLLADALETANTSGKFPGELLKENNKLLIQKRLLKQRLENLLKITDDSQGVSGYHLNDKIALWNEFPEVESALSLIQSIEKE